MERDCLLVICGPTASGKGVLAREIAEQVGGEIVVLDSRKIYRGLDIGTGKPTPTERARVPHHLLDVCAPSEVFTAARYQALADLAIKGIRARGRLPIAAGGTGLYLRVLLHGIIETPPRDEALRAHLEAEERSAPGCLYQRLQEVDPVSAARLPPGDRMRIVRALEVFLATGRPLSEHHAAHRFAPKRYPALLVAPEWPRPELRARIERRVDAMLAAGWLDEVRALGPNSPALAVVGYREIAEHLSGRTTFEEARAAIKRAHWQYARSQLTWFRALPELKWLAAPVNAQEVLDLLGWHPREPRR